MKFNDDGLIVGYIKELLHNFNLPMIPVVTNSTILYDGRTYIKDNHVCKYEDGKFKYLTSYAFNLEILNVTKKFIINSSIYDTYTHKYLGDYLRFIRDYKGLNLMGMYNCFTGEKLSRVNYKSRHNNFLIDTSNDVYVYYSIPIKFNQTYSISIECDMKYDIACILYNDVFISSTPDELITESHKTISGSKFTQPYLISTYFDCAENLWKKEKDLRLIIKVPSSVKSSIAVLEGNFLPCSNIVDGKYISKLKEDDKGSGIVYSKNSLLYLNDRESKPFADRLIEYLLENAITNLDFISQNIERIQNIIYKNKSFKGYYGIWDDNIKKNIYSSFFKKDSTKGSNRYNNKIEYKTTICKNIIQDGNIKLKYSLSAMGAGLSGGGIEPLYIGAGNSYTLSKGEKLSIYIYFGETKIRNYVIDNITGEGHWEDTYISDSNPYKVVTFPADEDDTNTYSISCTENLYVGNLKELENNEPVTITVSQTNNDMNKMRFIDSYYDLYGYVDKDVETFLRLQ